MDSGAPMTANSIYFRLWPRPARALATFRTTDVSWAQKWPDFPPAITGLAVKWWHLPRTSPLASMIAVPAHETSSLARMATVMGQVYPKAYYEKVGQE
jgi:hypothetical protein